MRYGIAAWNYQEPGVGLPALVASFLDEGFDAVSLQAHHLARMDRAEAREVAALLARRSAACTLHSNFELTTPADVDAAMDLLGGSLRSLTFDAAMAVDSRGTFYDAPRMAALLRHVEQVSRGTGLRFGVEDFPLDADALAWYRESLEPLLECPRFGMLIDVGHLNLRRHAHPYFRGRSVGDYLAAAPLPVVEVHVHDNTGERDQHGHLGFGNIAFEEVAAGLRRIGFEGVSTIEIAPSFHGSTPAESRPRARESLARWRELWESSAAA